ncbi:tetratricopeptide repeat protein [Polynucleobacter sp. 80A-SIGWE]|nr:tetratricopeptide repeat protein [Polynucleobacter sp. 80A-SIGWE]
MQNFLESMIRHAVSDFEAKNYDASEKLLMKVLQAQKNNLPALHIMGLIRAIQERHPEAADCFKKALVISPQEPSLYYNLAKALSSYGRNLEAIKYHQKSVELAGNNPEAWVNYGNSLVLLGRENEAIKMFEKALTLNPASIDALLNLGECYRQLEIYERALEYFKSAIQLDEASHLGWLGRGRVEASLKDSESAIKSYIQCLHLNPEGINGYLELGLIYLSLMRHADALSCYQKAHKMYPSEEFLLGKILNLSLVTCSWTVLPELISEISLKITQGFKIAYPFTVLSAIDSPDLQLRAAQIWAENFQLTSPLKKEKISLKSRGKIRIGYFSADFYNHATLHLMADFFEKHDKTRFEIFAFSYGKEIKDSMFERVATQFDGYYYIGNESDEEVAKMAREMDLDIAVDLKGYTYDGRPGIFMQKAAPLQVNYLGYPGTLGTSNVDYIIADPILIPEALQKFYSEKIIYLPNSYQINDPQRLISTREYSRKELGLPEDAFIYCGFNQHYKILPAMFDVWARILNRVDDSILWLLVDDDVAKNNLRNEIELRGINPNRLFFADKIPTAEHLSRMKLGDLFLDTYPCNSHTTASDALWVGLPILTYQGDSFSARVASSLLIAIELPELVTSSLNDYENLAVELAVNRDKLKDIKCKLESNRLTTTLFNSTLTTHHIESAYEKIVDLAINKMQSKNIYIN